MFSLIITIISIALVAALALATIYYGGTAFNKGSAEAKASQLINEGQQVNGAVAMQKADVASASNGQTANAASLATLVTGSYLAQVPANWTADAGFSRVEQTAVSDAVCAAINSKAGVTTLDSETEVAGATGVADVAAAVTGSGSHVGKVYGCVPTTSDNIAFYRF